VSKPFYITTTLPYVNSKPHIGFAMELVRADVIARFKKQRGFDVFFNTGTDEHGIKIANNAKLAGLSPQEYVDSLVPDFKNLIELLGILPEVNFIRTTDETHIKSAQNFWKICYEKGYIYKAKYKVKYCNGCELEKTDSDLDNGKCPLHPSLEIEEREEENYFFKFSEFQKPLLDLYEKNPNLMVPDFRFNEIKKFVEGGLKDFSISRLKEKMAWGIPVPEDSNHVMYVWFDALVNYVSAVGWDFDMKKFEKWWNESGGVYQCCGKDNVRQQGVIWQAMLIACGLHPSKQIFVNGFIQNDGQKMSKSTGNVVSPYDIVDKYSADVFRYLVTRDFHSYEDSDFTWAGLETSFNANLANGLGNFISRILKMTEGNVLENDKVVLDIFGGNLPDDYLEKDKKYGDLIEKYNLSEAMNLIWQEISIGDAEIQETKPFVGLKGEGEEKEKAISVIKNNLKRLAVVTFWLSPFMPETAEIFKSSILNLKKPDILFPRR